MLPGVVGDVGEVGLEPMYDRRSAWLASGDRGSAAIFGTDLSPSTATYGNVRPVIEGSSDEGTSNDNLFVRRDISLSASELVSGDIAVLAEGGGTGRAVI